MHCCMKKSKMAAKTAKMAAILTCKHEISLDIACRTMTLVSRSMFSWPRNSFILLKISQDALLNEKIQNGCQNSHQFNFQTRYFPLYSM